MDQSGRISLSFLIRWTTLDSSLFMASKKLKLPSAAKKRPRRPPKLQKQNAKGRSSGAGRRSSRGMVAIRDSTGSGVGRGVGFSCSKKESRRSAKRRSTNLNECPTTKNDPLTFSYDLESYARRRPEVVIGLLSRRQSDIRCHWSTAF